MNIEKLKIALENVKMLQGSLRDRRKLLDKEIELIAMTRQNLCEVLYDMTGDEFYKDQMEGIWRGKL